MNGDDARSGKYESYFHIDDLLQYIINYTRRIEILQKIKAQVFIQIVSVTFLPIALNSSKTESGSPPATHHPILNIQQSNISVVLHPNARAVESSEAGSMDYYSESMSRCTADSSAAK